MSGRTGDADVDAVTEVVKVAARAAMERLGNEGLSFAFVVHAGPDARAAIGGINVGGDPRRTVDLLVRGARALAADMGEPFVVMPVLGSDL